VEQESSESPIGRWLLWSHPGPNCCRLAERQIRKEQTSNVIDENLRKDKYLRPAYI